jgi:hypothetical protein
MRSCAKTGVVWVRIESYHMITAKNPKYPTVPKVFLLELPFKKVVSCKVWGK